MSLFGSDAFSSVPFSTAPSVLENRVLLAESGTYIYAGTSANTLYKRRMATDDGTYSYIGTDATLSYQTANGYTLIAFPGTYSYTGANASTLVYRKIAGEAGTYSYVGADNTLTHTQLDGYKLVADSGSYNLTGSYAILSYSGNVPYKPTVVVSGRNAREEWEARQKWRKMAETLFDEPEQEVETESVQDAVDDIIPRLYDPVESLAELVADAKLLQLDEAMALESAMAVRDVLAIAELAYLAELAVQQEKDAIAAFLMFME